MRKWNRIYVLLAAMLLLSGCTADYSVTENCINTTTGCRIDSTIYANYGVSLCRFSPAFPEGTSLCFDPLCSHSDEEFCAELSMVSSVVSDGERLYVKTHSFGMAQITSLGIDGSGRKTLAEYSMCDGLVTGISTDGQYVYYVEGLYRDSDSRNGESYGVPMRISCDGGEPEAFLDGEYGAYAEIFADAENYYITDNGLFHVIDRKTEEVQTVNLPTADTDGIVLLGGNVYLLGITDIHDYQINCRFTFSRRALWRWNGAEFEKVITNIDQLVWDEDGVWYTPMLPVEDFVLLGSKESYDGQGMSLYDFIRTWTGELIHHDLAAGEKTVYHHENVNLKIEPVGVSNGYIIAAVNDYDTLTLTYDKVNLKPEADGTVTVHEAIKAEREAEQ